MDDTDTRFDITNRGLSGKPYYVEVYDYEKPDAPYWNGITSNFWNLLDLAFPDEKIASMKKMFKAMEELSGSNADTSYKKVMAFYDKYFWSKAQDYFPHTAYNADAKYCYEDGKLAYNAGSYSNDTDPITQSLGDHYLAEKRWVSKRIIYMMSKYNMGDFVHNAKGAITFRAKGYNIDFQITPAINMYPTLANGTSIVEGTRTEAGEVCNVSVPLGGAGDQQIAILGADYLLDIGDWYDKQAFSSMIISGSRLTDIRLGHATEPITIDIDSLTISNCVSLQRLDLTRIWNLQSSLDLSACTHLKEILFKGTQLTEIELPESGFLEKLEFGEKLQRLKLFNQNRISNNNISFESKESIKTLWIENCTNIKALELLKSLANITNIRLVGIDESTNDASVLLDNVNKSGINNNGDNTGSIVISGNVHIINLFAGELEQLSLSYPNLVVTYDNMLAPPIRTITIKDENGNLISDAEVVFKGESYYTDSTGIVTLSIPDGGIFEIKKEGYLGESVVLDRIIRDTYNTVFLTKLFKLNIYAKDTNSISITNAEVTVNGNVKKTDGNGLATFDVVKGSHSYSVTYNSVTRTGTATISTTNVSVNTSFERDILEFKPTANGDIQFLIGGVTSIQLGFQSTSSNYTIHWGDGTSTQATGTGPRIYSKTYPNNGYWNISVSGNLDLFISNWPPLSVFYAWWSIGNSTIQNLSFNNNTNLRYVSADVFKNDSKRTSFASCFSNCYKLTSIPEGLFNKCTAVTSFSNCFGYCELITSIPEGLFKFCTEVTSFSGTFDRCGYITSIPDKLFKFNTKVTTFEGCFRYATSNSYLPRITIPAGLFDSCTNVTSFKECFYNTNIISNIPTGIFDNCTKVATFEGCFRLSKITSIPEGLFNKCTAVTSFSNCFGNCYKLTSIPEGLFDKCTAATDFNNCFRYCELITSIPKGLFKFNTRAIYFNDCFTNCKNLVAIPTDLFDDLAAPLNYSFMWTFNSCSKLINGVIPEFVSVNINNMYNYTSSLNYIIVKPTTPPTYSNTITGNSTFRVYVLDTSIDAYKNASGWSGFADRIFPMTQFETDFPQI